MTDLLVRGSEGERPLARVRGTAISAMTECLRIQASARRRSRLSRVLGVSPLAADAKAWYRSALGELRVTEQLRALPASWTVLVADDPDSGRLLIGPGGVYSLHVRDHVGQRIHVDAESLQVNGRRTNHLANARHEAMRASRLLSSGVDDRTDVTPVIAVVDPGSLQFGTFRPMDAVVLAAGQLTRVLLRRPDRLVDDAARGLVASARATGLWQLAAATPDDGLRHESRFARLQDAVRGAARRRAAWGLSCAAVLAAAIVLPLV